MLYLGKKQKFFFQFSEGIKGSFFVKGELKEENGLGGLFYITRPGAFAVFNINFGLRF